MDPSSDGEDHPAAAPPAPAPAHPDFLRRQTSGSKFIEEYPDRIDFASLVRISCRVARQDLLSPWVVSQGGGGTGSGFHIGGRRIVTNHHVTKDAVTIRLERYGRPGNFSGRLLCSGPDCDLALLTCDDDAFWEVSEDAGAFGGGGGGKGKGEGKGKGKSKETDQGKEEEEEEDQNIIKKLLPAVRFDQRVPRMRDEILVVGFPLGIQEVAVTQGVVSAVKMDPKSSYMMVQVSAAINSGNSGGPVFDEQTNLCVGVAYQSFNAQDAQQTGFIIPSNVVQHFLNFYERTGQEDFSWTPDLGVHTQDLINPSLRLKAFGGPTMHRNGVLIRRVKPGSIAARAGLKIGDVLLAIDDKAVTERGKVSFRGPEMLDLDYLMTFKSEGDTFKITVLREGHCKDKDEQGEEGEEEEGGGGLLHITATVCAPPPSLVPWSAREAERQGRPSKTGWCVICGLVFTRVTFQHRDEYLLGRRRRKKYSPMATRIMYLDQEDLKLQRILAKKEEKEKNKAKGSGEEEEKDDNKDDKEGEEEEEEEEEEEDEDLIRWTQEDLKEAVVLADVQANDLNITYESFNDELLYSLNGTRVTSLAHLAQMIDACRRSLSDEAGSPDRIEYMEFVFSNGASLHPKKAVLETASCFRDQDKYIERYQVPGWVSGDIDLSAKE